jgi:outer membrane protein
MKSIAPLTLLALALAVTGLKAEDEGPWMVRVRAVNLRPAETSDSIGVLDTPFYYPGNSLQVNAVTLPEVDLSYGFTSNFSAELMLALPQSHTVMLTNIGTAIGTFKEMPMALLAQWHFMPGSAVNPYVGLGMNYTKVSSVNLILPGAGPVTLSSSSMGMAAQAGADIKVGDHWFVNLDIKYLAVQSDVNAEGAKLSSMTLNPMLYGLGLGFTF